MVLRTPKIHLKLEIMVFFPSGVTILLWSIKDTSEYKTTFSNLLELLVQTKGLKGID